MKSLKSFFDSRRAHEDVEDIWGLLFLTLIGTLIPFFLVAPVTSTVTCAILVLISLSLRALKMTMYTPLAYGVGIIALTALKSSLPGGMWSHEFFATTWTVFAICKSFRVKKYGDAEVLLILTLASNACVLLLDDSMTVSVWSTVMAVIAIGQLLRLNIKDVSSVTLLASLKSATLMTVYALPLLTFLFFIFHKATSFHISWHSGHAATGLSDTLEPGQVSKLTLNTAPAFRAKLDRPLPGLDGIYWRATTLTESYGMQWRSQPLLEKPNIGALFGQRTCIVNQTIYVQQGGQLPFKVGLDRPLPITYNGNNFYTLQSRLCDWQEHLTAEEREQNLKVHVTPSPQLKALISAFKSAAPTPDGISKKILSYYKHEGFKYTLTPGQPFSHLTLDQFLFQTKEGFCEHFAAATSTLLRLAGVPSRIVVGFEGGDYNAIGGYWLVSYSDAHAWVEMWSDEKGWIRLDPASIFTSAHVAGPWSPVRWASNASDAFFFEISTILNNREKLFSLSDFTFDSWLALFCLALLFTALQFKKWLRPMEQTINDEFDKLCHLLGERGLPRRRSEGFEAYRQRVGMWMNQLPGSRKVADAVDRLFVFYIANRYEAKKFSTKELKELARGLQQIQWTLRLKTVPLVRWFQRNRLQVNDARP